MNFEKELLYLKAKIETAETTDDLNYLQLVHEKNYWWTSIIITGLFYGLNGKILKMILAWILNPFTLWIYGIYLIFTSYQDEKEFNERMEFYIIKRKKELNNISKNHTKPETSEEFNFEKEDNIAPQSIKIPVSDDTNPTLKNYEKQVHELENLYKIKEKMALELVEKRFTPPQITYDRFMGVINSCSQIFYKQTEATLNILKIATEHTHKVDTEIEKRLATLKSLIEKLDELTYELAINISNSEEQSSEEIKDLLKDMQNLVESVKEYN